MMRLLATTLLSLTMVACVGPQADVAATGEVDPALAELEAVRKNATELESYRDLSGYFLSRGDLERASEVAQLATVHYPQDYRAWLLKAHVARSALKLRDCETALKQALSLAPDNIEVSNALLGFYEAVFDDQKVVSLLAAKQGDRYRTHLALKYHDIANYEKFLFQASLFDFDVRMPNGSTIASDRDPIEKELVILRRADIEGDHTRVENLLCRPRHLEPGDDALLALRASSIANTKECVNSLYNRQSEILEDHEDPQLRFAAYLGLWTLAWNQASKHDIPIHPPQADETEVKLNQIDPNNPEWLMRSAMVTAAEGVYEERNPALVKIKELGVPLPPLFGDVKTQLTLWAIEDAMRLGLYNLARKKLASLQPSTDNESFLNRVEFRLDFAQRKHERVLAAIPKLISGELSVGEDAEFARMYFISLLRAGRVSDALEDLKAPDKAMAAHLNPKTLLWLRAVAEYHQETPTK